MDVLNGTSASARRWSRFPAVERATAVGADAPARRPLVSGPALAHRARLWWGKRTFEYHSASDLDGLVHVPIHQFFFEVNVTRFTCIVDGFLAIFAVVVGREDEERLGAEKNAEAIRRRRQSQL